MRHFSWPFFVELLPEDQRKQMFLDTISCYFLLLLDDNN